MSDRDAYRQRKAFFNRMITVYGRKPVLEILLDRDLECHAVHLAESNHPSGIIKDIERQAQTREITVKWHSREALARISRNGKQDQGAAVDVVCPAFSDLETYLSRLPDLPPQRLLALDGITNPQNLGMILRSAAAGPIDGVICSTKGNAALGPLVIKASAGTLYRSPLIRCEELDAALNTCKDRGLQLCTLAADASTSLFDHQPDGHCVYVLGNETTGVSTRVEAMADTRLSIPMNRGVESLNVAVTAGLIIYANTLQRRHDSRIFPAARQTLPHGADKS